MEERFGDVLKEYVDRANQSAPRLGKLAGISAQTIYSWLSGAVSHPRNQQDIVAIAAALRLLESETNRFLKAAGHEVTIDSLVKQARADQDGKTLQELSFWISARDQESRLQTSYTLEVPFQVPARTDHFVGREEVIEKLEAALRLPGQICVVRGLGGVGKTALARELAIRLRASFPDGILWASLDNAVRENTVSEDALMSILIRFGQAYGIVFSEETDLQSRSRRITELLASKRVLIVLDNAFGTADVLPLLPPDESACSILITTRNRKMLPLALHVDLANFDLYEGLALFRRVLDDARLDDEVQGATRIIELLGGLPLAISIVAQYLAESPDLTLHEYCELLLDERERLSHLADWEDASKNVRASFELSYRRLTLPLQTLFIRLAIFGGNNLSSPTFDAAAVAAISGQSIALVKRQLAPLLSLSLVTEEYAQQKGEARSDGSVSRYHLHPLLRLFAREKWAEVGIDSNALLDQAVSHYTSLAITQAQNYSLLDADRNNILDAIDWAKEQEDWDLFLEAVSGLTRYNLGAAGYLDAHGDWREAATILDSALQSPQISINPQVQAELHLKRATFALRLAEYDLAETHYQQSLALFEELDGMQATLRQAQAYEGMATLWQQRDPQVAETWLQRGLDSLALLTEIEAQHEWGYLAVRHASSLGKRGQFEAARERAETGVAKLPDYPSHARVSGRITLGAAYYYLGDVPRAVQIWEQAVIDAQALNDRRREANLHQNLGNAHSFLGKYNDSSIAYEKAAHLYEQIGDVAGASDIHANQTINHMLLGRFDAAWTSITHALQLAETHRLPQAKAQALTNRARLQLHQEQITTAEKDLVQAEAITRQIEDDLLLSETLHLQAELARQNGHPVKGLKLAQSAIAMAVDPVEAGKAWRVKGALLSVLGTANEAETGFEKSDELLTNQDPYEQACTWLAWGEHCQLINKSSDGRRLAQQALDVFKWLGLNREISSASRLLSRSA